MTTGHCEWGADCSSGLGDLDGGLLVDAQEGDVRHPDEGPPLAGPELDHGALLRGLRRSVEVGKTHTAQVRRQTDQDVPGEGEERNGGEERKR